MLISEPGIYDISAHDYHRTEICIGPSISSSGLRALSIAPIKYWYNSPLNPNRPVEDEKAHFVLGRAAHDLVLDGVGWPDRYYVLPKGFSRAASVKQAAAIADADAAEARGLTLLKHDEHATVLAMADAISNHAISKVLGRGKAEATIVWKDEETGVWLRCRPDFLPDAKKFIPDYKTTVSAHPDDFRKDVANYGYHQQAALYLDGLAAVFGVAERDFYFIAQEKTAPYIVQPFALDAEAVEWGHRLNRKAIRTFAKCLETNKWPAYSDDFITVGLPHWQVAQLESAFTGELP